MTNYEYYKDEIEKIARLGIQIALINKDEIVPCDIHLCAKCKFRNKNSNITCRESLFKWADQSFIEDEDAINWDNVPVDTKIYVRTNTSEKWLPRYFAEYKYGKVYAWNDGKTSFTIDNMSCWDYVKLAESSNEREKIIGD